jgi:hypothetical protein
MPRRAHQTEHRFAMASAPQGGERCTRGGPGIVRDARIARRILVEICVLSQPGNMFGGMGTQDRLLAGDVRLRPRHRKFGLGPELFQRPGNTRRFFGVTGSRVTGAGFVSDDFQVMSSCANTSTVRG